jgi:hypothetical protein
MRITKKAYVISTVREKSFTYVISNRSSGKAIILHLNI